MAELDHGDGSEKSGHEMVVNGPGLVTDNGDDGAMVGNVGSHTGNGNEVETVDSQRGPISEDGSRPFGDSDGPFGVIAGYGTGSAPENLPGKEEAKGPKKKQPGTVPFIRLFSFADKYDYCLMLLGSIGAVGHGAGMPVFLLFFGSLLNLFGEASVLQHGFPRHIVDKYALYFLYLGLATLVTSWMEVSCWMITGDRQSARLRTKYLEALLRHDVAFFDTDTNTGNFVSSIASDPLMVQDAISEKMGNFMHFMGTFVAGFIVGFSRQWRIALVTIAVIPLIGIAGFAYAYARTYTTARTAEAYAEAGTIAEQALAQVRTVYSFVSESKFVKAYNAALETTVMHGRRGGLAMGFTMGFTYTVVHPSFALLVWYGSILIRQGLINGGEAMSCMFAVIIGALALGQAMPNLTAFSKGKVAAYNIFQMIDHNDSKINVFDPNAQRLEKVAGHIELRNVDFSYPARPDVPIFQNFNLVIPAESTMAIVGSSGSGKSTVVSLLERFYDPTAGEVLLDGHDIKRLDLKWLRGRIGLVNQEPALFATTIGANILYGKDDATQEEIEEAAKAANAHSFIEKLPLGYQTQVGERGVQLSGGQKQRVAIARAMLKNPTVLLLDEATSALDAGSEQVVQEALDRLNVGRTTVIVAHRLSTIRNAHSIAVVQHGQVVEKGTHHELISNPDGTYSALVHLQELASTRDHGGSNSSRSLGSSSFRIGHSKGKSRGSRSFNAESFRRSYSGFVRVGSSRPDEEFNDDDEDPKNKSGRQQSKGSFLRLLAMCWPDWKYCMAGVMGSILAGCLFPVFGLLVGDTLTTYYEVPEKMKKNVATYAEAFVGLGGGALCIYILQHYSIGVVGENLVKRIREKMFFKILRNELGWYDMEENNSSQILARLNSDSTHVRGAIGDRAALMLENATLVIVSWTVTLGLQWKLSLVIISVTPLLVFASATMKFFQKSSFSGDLSKSYARATQVAGEAVTNIRTVAAFNAETKVQALFAKELQGPAASSFLTGQVAGLGLGFSQLCQFGSYALGMWYAGILIADEGASFGNCVKVFIVLVLCAYAMAETLAVAPDLIKGGQAVASVFEVLDRETSIEPEDLNGEHVTHLLGNIDLKNVTFAYPSRPNVTIFKNLSLKVLAARSLALVGASGSGKSSVIALIERFYDPISGQILIDGKDIKKYNLRSVRKHIALVQQQPALFATSIHQNIVYGKDGASEAEVIEAAKAANAHNFISSLPDGYKTQVGERGVQLSGGQKQRVAIARAVLKDPTILLLDEATSSLDAESEKIVQDALDRLMKGRTTVIVAHRLTTIQGADTIAVVQDGNILEEGSHAELVAEGGGYARLINLQTRSQEAKAAETSKEFSRYLD
ncbi:unnamed protein product [Calypogeia fissa]